MTKGVATIVVNLKNTSIASGIEGPILVTPYLVELDAVSNMEQ